ncbi:MAG: cobalt ECF transporter T component CbiQ [Solibacillus sp.]|uniref:cobalt ECF transporter T component CbiQ n=1 Tax=Solibacillus sp. TaxID=1909654 RepID=UPI003315099A
MLNIDYLAHNNALKRVAASQKLVISVSALLTVTILRNNSIALWTLLFMSGVIVYYAKIPWKTFGKLMLAPLGFSIAGVLTILASFSLSGEVPSNAMWAVTTEFVSLYILLSDGWRALNIFIVAFSATSCLYFLILTTPIYEISPILLKCKVPSIVVELMELTYRFIFIFFQTAEKIYTAQHARLGYKNYRVSFQSLSLLIIALFQTIFFRYQTMTLAMKARNIEQFILPQIFLSQKNWQPKLIALYTGYITGVLLLVIFY